ncbi:MAG: DUF5668 domain-containing protein [Acidobacteriia bacterium]|nr:DUF5668 domain-containing protein [Terriglobia bacterium]
MTPNDPLTKNAGPSALLVLGLLLVGIGILVLFGNLDVIPYGEWHRYWPVVLIIVGVAELARFRRARP